MSDAFKIFGNRPKGGHDVGAPAENERHHDGDAAVIRSGDYPLDLAAARAALEQGNGKRFWRSLEELAGTPESEAFLHHEFPNDPEKELPRSNGMARRDMLKLMAASAALSGLSAIERR